jgi:beta-N-acetylhexosaminidase
MSRWTARTLARLFVLVVALSAMVTPSAAAQDRWIDNTIRGMTLEEKVGQLFVANVYGRTANTRDPADVSANQAMYGPGIRNANQLIDRYKLGGIVYFRWTNNLADPAQIARLSNGIQEAALSQPAGIPMLIATDQEHGVVSRVWAPATAFPGNMALGATRREADASDAARVTATELGALGINQNYAPVADVNVNPSIRSSACAPSVRARSSSRR